MNNMAEICLVGLGVEENYVRYRVIIVSSMRLGGTKRCVGGFKVIILRGQGKGACHKKRTSFDGVFDSSIHYVLTRYVILLF